MIPRNLDWAFKENRRVHTPGGTGRTKRRQLAGLVLPSGQVSMGLPDDGMINKPSEVHQVLPGIYPVFISIASRRRGQGTVAFVVVNFADAKTTSWEEAGEFFTDSGDGCIYDAGVASALRAKKDGMSSEDWWELKNSTLKHGDGSLILDAESGANAIVFRTCDWVYRCFVGRGGAGQATCLVVDGRVHH